MATMRKRKPKPDYSLQLAIGAEIREIRKLDGRTAASICKAAGVPVRTWYAWEENGPPMKWLSLIAKTLDVGPSSRGHWKQVTPECNALLSRLSKFRSD